MHKNVNFYGIVLHLGDVIKFNNNNSHPDNDKMKNREFAVKKIQKRALTLAPKSACYKQRDGSYKIEGKEELKIKWDQFTNFETTGLNLFEVPKKRGRKKKES
jgi:hypothetical protein